MKTQPTLTLLTALLSTSLTALQAATPQDIEWNTPQFIVNSRQPAEGMMHPGEMRLAGPRVMRTGEALRAWLRAVPPVVPINYHGVYRKVELRPELRVQWLDSQQKVIAGTILPFAPETWQAVPLANQQLAPGDYTLRAEIMVEGGSVFSRVEKEVRVVAEEEGKSLAALQKDAPAIAKATGLKQTQGAVLIPKGTEADLLLPGKGRVAVYGRLTPPSAAFAATLGATRRNLPAFRDATFLWHEVFLGVGEGGRDALRLLSGAGEVRLAGIRLEPLSEDVSFVPGSGNQGKQLVVNNDGGSEGFFDPAWNPESLPEMVERYQGTDVSQFEFATNLPEAANFRSRFVDFYGEHFKGTWPTKGYEAQFRSYDYLDKHEPRLFPWLNARCREIGVTFWGSLRMTSDYSGHPEYAALFHSRFQNEREDMRVLTTPTQKPPSFYLSFVQPAVRERRIGVLRELAEFGCAGVNLDFCRYPTVLGYEEPMLKRFTEAHGEDGTKVPFDDPRWVRVRQEVMNGFLRELRTAMNGEGQKRGQPVRISVRLPATKYETFGFDPQTWIREGLVDALIPAFPGWERWFEIAPWVAMAKGSKVEIWPGTEFYFHETSTGELTDADVAAGKKPGAMWLLSRADYLRRAAEAYAAGAQGFYLFNAWGAKHVKLTRGITDAKFVANWRRHLDPENLGSEIAPDAVPAENSQGKKP
jgi:hypothetical protein